MQWTVGRVKISQIVEMESDGGASFILPQATRDELRKISWLSPDFASAEGRMKLYVQSWIVETPAHRIIVDTCLGNDKQGRSVPHWNNRNEPFLEKLAAAGYPAETIDTVLCTHLHVDHVGWNTKLVNGQWVPTFAKARYVFGKTEYDHWAVHSPDGEYRAVFDDSVQPIVTAGLADLVTSDHRIGNEISLIPTPGHSPGHMSILVESEGASALLTGDVLHHPSQMVHLDWSASVDFDPQQSTETRKTLFSRFAGTETLLFGGHFKPGHLVREGQSFKLNPVQANS